jgi:eukaryotic-like serine/threonine-protein kinase
VALKILPPSLARDKNLLLRFHREVDVAARLSHPNIVSVLDADEDRGVQFMTMEYIDGNDLDRLIRDGGVLSIEQALDCVTQAAKGLEAAHAQGIVHRDIKPGNLMLDQSGVVRVLDLGLARLVEAANPFGENAPGQLTRSGTYIGTVDFMAPEQGVDSRQVDHRADIYSLGCTLCYLLTGRPPFDGANVLARLMAHQERLPKSLLAARPTVPRALDATYQRMMAKKPDDRPASMTEVVRLLEACRSPSIEAGAVRSGLKTLAQSIISRHVAPQETIRDGLPLRRGAPAVLARGTDLTLEDTLIDQREPNRPAATASPTVVSELSHLPKPKTAPPTLGSRVYPMRPVALGALCVLGAIGLGAALVVYLRPGATEHGDASIRIRKPVGEVHIDATANSLATGAKAARVTTNSIGMKLVLIPAGEFSMGGSVFDDETIATETPQHPVTISRPFYLGMTEVTQGQYRAVTGKSPSSFTGSDDLPVEQVSWSDAVAFCNALSAKEERAPFYRIERSNVDVRDRNVAGYRLPTEAEWEYACRAGNTKRFHFGGDVKMLDQYAWYKNNSNSRTHPVAQMRANAFGLYDMHGNVWEWCADWFSVSYYKESPAIDPIGPPMSSYCVYRSGSWNHDARNCRSSTRHREPPTMRDRRLGFRVALNPSPR